MTHSLPFAMRSHGDVRYSQCIYSDTGGALPVLSAIRCLNSSIIAFDSKPLLPFMFAPSPICAHKYTAYFHGIFLIEFAAANGLLRRKITQIHQVRQCLKCKGKKCVGRKRLSSSINEKGPPRQRSYTYDLRCMLHRYDHMP